MSGGSSSLQRFRAVASTALAALQSRREEINDLNVFPVADGDTGDNMVKTLESVVAELDRLIEQQGDGTLDSVGRAEIVDAVSSAALLGGRGNSGVILSQLIHGAAEVMIDDEKNVDPLMLAQAMARAAEQARGSVADPREGTILTVIDDMAKRLLSKVDPAAGELPEGIDESEQNALLAHALEAAVSAGDESLDRGPDLLPELRQFGVSADAGGYGLVVLFAGIVAGLRSGDAPPVAHREAPAEKPAEAAHASTTFRYCVNFAVVGEGLDQESFRGPLETLGDSLMVVASRTGSVLRVHVHSDDPDSVQAVFAEAGELRDLEVADMFSQIDERTRRIAGARSLILAVVAGESMRELFESESSIVVLDSGDTLNPSTEELLDAIHSAPAEELVLITGSRNVTPAAEKAAELTGRTVHIVETGMVHEGLAVAHHHSTSDPASVNAAALESALAVVVAGGIAPADKDDPNGRYAKGDAVGFLGGELVAWGAPGAVAEAIAAKLPEDVEIVTVIDPGDTPVSTRLDDAFGDRFEEVERLTASHPGWWVLFAAE